MTVVINPISFKRPSLCHREARRAVAISVHGDCFGAPPLAMTTLSAVYVSLGFCGLTRKAHEFQHAVIASKRRNQVHTADAEAHGLHQVDRDPDPFRPASGWLVHAVAH